VTFLATSGRVGQGLNVGGIALKGLVCNFFFSGTEAARGRLVPRHRVEKTVTTEKVSLAQIASQFTSLPIGLDQSIL
jgi:hypothetical protein